MVEDKHSKEHRTIRKDIREARGDMVNVEKKIDKILDELKEMPKRDEFPI